MELNATTRTIKGKSVKTLRRKNIIPAVIYGHKVEPQLLQVDFLNFEKIYKEAGESTLIDLKLDNNAPVKVLIHDIKKDFISNKISHIDFYQIRKGEKITTEIELEFVGEAKAVKELGGVLVRNLTKIKVECLPEDLVHNIKVDISKLNTFEDSVKIKDLNISSKLKFKEKEEEIVALVLPPREEEKEEEKPEEQKIEEVEVLKEKKKEEVEAPKEEKSNKK